MYKVVRYVPSSSTLGTTTTNLFEKVTQPGSAEEEVKTGFPTEEDAQKFIDELYKNNRMTQWQYAIRKE